VVVEGDARTSEERRQLDVLLRDGYVVVRQAISEARCTSANSDLDDFKRKNRRAIARNVGESGHLRRVVNLHLAVDALAAVFSENAALSVCDQFFDAEAVLYTSLLFERGSEQSLHRDSPAFVTRPEGRYLGLWTALEDMDALNGPLVVVPRSHTLPNLDVDAMAVELYGDPATAPAKDDAAWDTYQNAVQDLCEAHGLVAVELHVRAGDAVVWHPLLFHGGAPHRSPARTRRSFVMHVTPYGMPVYHQDVFFNADKDVPDVASWQYYERGGRKIAQFTAVEFAHEYALGVSALQRPGAGVSDRLELMARRAKQRLLGRRRRLPRGTS
jgi:ectoine hydroxylase-related dioxygenase (phytanoyl-CoA dioxygenase family)